jgi:WD40 repeat protein
VAFSPDGATVAVANATQVVVWNLARRTAVLTLPVSSQVRALAFSPDGRLWVAANNDGTVRL